MQNIEPEEVIPEEQIQEKKEEPVTTIVVSGDAVWRDLRAQKPGFGIITNSRPEVEEKKSSPWKDFFWTAVIALAGCLLIFFLHRSFSGSNEETKVVSDRNSGFRRVEGRSNNAPLLRPQANVAPLLRAQANVAPLSRTSYQTQQQTQVIFKAEGFPVFPRQLTRNWKPEHILSPFDVSTVAQVRRVRDEGERIISLMDDLHDLIVMCRNPDVNSYRLLCRLRQTVVSAFKRKENVLGPNPDFTDMNLKNFFDATTPRVIRVTGVNERLPPLISFEGSRKALFVIRYGHVHNQLDSLLKCVCIALCGKLDREILLINRLLLSIALVDGQEYFHKHFCKSPECAATADQNNRTNRYGVCFSVRRAVEALLDLTQNLRISNNTNSFCWGHSCLQNSFLPELNFPQDVYFSLLSIIFNRVITVFFLTDPDNGLAVRSFKSYFPNSNYFGRAYDGNLDDRHETQELTDHAWLFTLSGNKFNSLFPCPLQYLPVDARTNDPSVLD